MIKLLDRLAWRMVEAGSDHMGNWERGWKNRLRRRVALFCDWIINLIEDHRYM